MAMLDFRSQRQRVFAGLASIFLIAVLLGLPGCGSEAKPVTAETTKFRPADDAQPVAAGSDAAVVAPPSAPPVIAEQRSRQPQTTGSATAGSIQAATQTAASNKAQNPEIQQLVAQIDRLAQEQPRGKTEQEQIEEFVRIHQQRLALGKKVLALGPDKNTKLKVVRAMYEVHTILNGPPLDRLLPGARQQLAEFTKSLIADADPDVARMGRHMQFDNNVSRLANEQLDNSKEIIGEVQRLLD